MKDAMISWFIDTLGGKVGGGFIVFLISMVPILELRGGLLAGTGAWTGALIAALLGIRFRKAFPAIVLGVFLAAFLMTVLSYGVLGALFA